VFNVQLQFRLAKSHAVQGKFTGGDSVQAFQRYCVSYEAHFVDNHLLLTTFQTTFARQHACRFFQNSKALGDRSAAATCFDEPGQPPFSAERFGDLAETSFVSGRVRRVYKDSCMVRWDDGYERQLSFQDLELDGDTLRAAEIQTRPPEESNLSNGGGGPRRSARNLPI
jgi:hypothetical protein